MSWEVGRHWLAPGRMLLQCGPMHMAIDARHGEEPHLAGIEAAVETALDALQAVANHRPLCRQWIAEITEEAGLPIPVRTMVQSARATGETWVTPMIAVAGTMADLAADAAFAAGATRVFCNNGGDIAVRLAPGASIRVGLNRGLDQRTVAGRLLIRAEDGIGGICTSGLGGRSLTCGIASAVTLFGARATTVDASATLVANHVYVDHPGVKRVPAEEVDPVTDIRGLPVTVAVDQLPPTAWATAVQAGAIEAERLRSLGLIAGAVLFAGPMQKNVPEVIPGLDLSAAAVAL